MIKDITHTFSVLAYQESPFLEECLTSLLKQSVKSEILLCTSTPSPFLSNIAAKYGLSLLFNPERAGIGKDWTFAYRQARTKYVTLAHQDDVYLPEYTENALNIIDNQLPKPIIIFTDYSELIGSKVVKGGNLSWLLKRISLAPFLFKNRISSAASKKMILFFGNPIACPTVMFNKQNIGDFVFSERLSCALDWEAWLRLIKGKGALYYVNKRLVLHRIHQEAQSYLLTKDKTRKREESELLTGIWPKPVANFLSNIHHFVASKSNTSHG